MSHFLLAAETNQPDLNTSYIGNIILILVLVLLNGFFAASEMAIVTINEQKVRREAGSGDKRAQQLLPFIENQGNFLAMVQVGVTLAGFLSSAFAASKFAAIIYYAIDPGGGSPWLYNLVTVVLTLLLSGFTLVFGELVPKRIALYRPEKFARTFVGAFRFFDFLLRPIARLIDWAAVKVSLLIGVNPDVNQERITEDEIRLMTEASKASGDIDIEEAEMINNIFELDDKEVSEIMTPRTNMVTLSVDSTYSEVREIAAHERYSRIPVYDEDIDDIVGVLHIKDLLRVPPEAQQDEHFDLRRIIRPALFTPESKSLSLLFREMQQYRHSIAVVVDEYGGTDGLVSIEDVLEQIVGNIEDEYDEEPEDFVENADGTYDLDGLLTIEEAARFLPALENLVDNEDLDDYDTMAGLVLGLLEYIPNAGEQPSVTYDNLQFTVLEMDDRRIARVRIKILPRPAAQEEEEKDKDKR